VDKLDADSWVTIGRPGRDFYRTDGVTCDLTRPPSQVRSATIDAQPKKLLLDLNRTAMIVVDMQNDFCTSGGYLDSLGVDTAPLAAICKAIEATTSLLRDAAVPIIWLTWGVREDRANLSPGTLLSFNPSGMGYGLGDLMTGPPTGRRRTESKVLTKSSWGAAIVEELKPQSTDIFVDKHRISGFIDTPLESILRNLNIRTLVFAGVNADECVLATLMDANFHGFDTILVEDGTATTSPQFCLDATLYNVRFCFGFTTTAEAIARGVSAADDAAISR
jgi:nicotinamidase-related amidase